MMLPKSKKQMFRNSMVDKMVLMLLPEDTFEKYQWQSAFNDFDVSELIPIEKRLIDPTGVEWRIIGIFLVTDHLPNQVEEEVFGPEGVFVEVDGASVDIWDPNVLRALVAYSDDERTLGDIQADWTVGLDQWAFIHPSELQNTLFRQSAINYRRIR